MRIDPDLCLEVPEGFDDSDARSQVLSIARKMFMARTVAGAFGKVQKWVGENDVFLIDVSWAYLYDEDEPYTLTIYFSSSWMTKTMVRRRVCRARANPAVRCRQSGEHAPSRREFRASVALAGSYRLELITPRVLSTMYESLASSPASCLFASSVATTAPSASRMSAW